MKKVLITTLGCKVNQYESAAFRTGLEAAGMKVVSRGGGADIVIINTCAVTGSAGAQSRQALRRALRDNPKARIIVTGCYAELAASELAAETELQGRDFSLVGNSRKDRIVGHLLDDRMAADEDMMGAIAAATEICRLPVRRFGDRSRAYLRIQDGCESFCTYCIVPFTRGPSRSLPEEEAIEQAKIYAEEGYREIILTGIHIGNYGRDLVGRSTLTSLLDRLSLATPGAAYRISSLEPLEIDETLLALMAERQSIQPHLHIPLQSGHDEILAAMNRRYTIAEFRERIELCRRWLPDAAIGIDILAGFPGESEAHFAESLDFLRSLDFTYLHVFPYSLRPGTVAAGLASQVPQAAKEERVAALRRLSEEKRRDFYRSQLGRTWPVIVEGRRDEEGLLQGFTANYVAARFAGPDSLRNGLAIVRLLELKDNHILGERIP